mgnify:CR=1 FL=1
MGTHRREESSPHGRFIHKEFLRVDVVSTNVPAHSLQIIAIIVVTIASSKDSTAKAVRLNSFTTLPHGPDLRGSIGIWLMPSNDWVLKHVLWQPACKVMRVRTCVRV